RACDEPMAASRIIAVTVGLMLAGAALGALCGVATVAPVIAGAATNARSWNDWSGILLMTATAGAFGGVIGTVLGPILAWTLLRRVPLGRVFRTAVRGTLAGSFAGCTVMVNPLIPGPGSVILGGVVGLIASCLVLRHRAARHVESIPLAPH